MYNKKHQLSFSSQLALFIGNNLQLLLQLLAFFISFILTFSLNTAYAGQHTSKFSLENAQFLEQTLVLIRHHVRENWGNMDLLTRNAPDFSGLPFKVTDPVSVLRETIALANVIGNIEPGLVINYGFPVFNFMGSESMDIFHSSYTAKFTSVDSFIKYLKHHISKDNPITAKINGAWGLFFYCKNNHTFIHVSMEEVANILEELDARVLNKQKLIVFNTSLTGHADLYDVDAVIKNWSVLHKSLDKKITRIPLGDIYLVFQNSKGELIKRLIDNKVILFPEAENFERSVIEYCKTIPHLAQAYSFFENGDLNLKYVEPFSLSRNNTDYLKQLVKLWGKTSKDLFLNDHIKENVKRMLLTRPGHELGQGWHFFTPHPTIPLHHIIAQDIAIKATKNFGELLLTHKKH